MNKWSRVTMIVTGGSLLPVLGMAQDGLSGNIQSLQGVLETLYNEMLPQCSSFIDAGRALAGFGALWYIAVRVWRHIARAEAIDLYPLLRPFALGLCILFFPSVIALMNGIIQPIVNQSAQLVHGSDTAVARLLQQKEAAIQNTTDYKMFVGPGGSGDESMWEQYSGEADSGMFSGVSNAVKFAMAKNSYNLRNTIKTWLSETLQLLYEAAALCVNSIRTFNLLILAILGPLVLGFSVFDGLTHTLSQWVARYINIALWLPVANLFGAITGTIQEKMLQMDLAEIQARGDTYFSSTDAGYLIFLIIAIVGYCCVPSIASHIVSAGGTEGLTTRVTRLGASISRLFM